MCAARSQLSKTLMSEEGRRGRAMSMLGRLRKGPEENPSFSQVRSLLILTRLPLIRRSPSLISFPLLPFYLLPLIFSLTLITLCTFLSHTHARLSSQPHTPAAIRQDSVSASISRVVSIWHRASRPLRHSPVPPHSALLVTRDNWGRNSKFQKRKKKKKKKMSLGLALSSTQDMKGCF